MADDLRSNARPFKPNRQITRQDLGGEDPRKMRKLDNKLALRAQRKQIQLLMKLPLKKEKQKKKHKAKKQKMRILAKFQRNQEALNEFFVGMLSLKQKKLLEFANEEAEKKESKIFGNWEALPDQIVEKILKMSVDDPKATKQYPPYDAPPKLKRYNRRNYLTCHRKALEFAKLSTVSRRFYHIINNPDNKFPQFPVGMKICGPIEGGTFITEKYQVYIYGGPGMKNSCQMMAAEDLVNCYRPCRLADILIIERVILDERLMNSLRKMDISKVQTIKFLDIISEKSSQKLKIPVENIISFLENAISLKQFEFSDFSQNVENDSTFLQLKGYLENRGIECSLKHYSLKEKKKYQRKNKHHAGLREAERKQLRANGYDLKPQKKPKVK